MDACGAVGVVWISWGTAAEAVGEVERPHQLQLTWIA